MSQENVELVRRLYAAVARRDVASVLASYDPDVEFRFSPGTVTDRIGAKLVYRGHAGLREFDSELRDAFTDFETNAEELIDAGARVVSVSRYRGQGRGSGIAVEGPVQFGVWRIQEDRITRVDWFPSRAEALEAAGLSA